MSAYTLKALPIGTRVIPAGAKPTEQSQTQSDWEFIKDCWSLSERDLAGLRAKALRARRSFSGLR